MSKRIIFHGSPDIIEKPYLGGSKDYNDYGNGFYCTQSIDLANEWACNEGQDGYTNKYEINERGLDILDLSEGEYSVLNWLAILLDNRIFRTSTPTEKKGKEYIVKNFLPDYKRYDVIIGYRADDSYFSFARSFISNAISVKQLEYAMKLGKLGEQYVLKSKKAYDAIKFIGYDVVNSAIYFARRKSRDDEARESFRKELEVDDINGVFIRDILKEEMKRNDSRLQ